MAEIPIRRKEGRNIWPLLIMGLVFPPLGLVLFKKGEHYAKVTGRLKRAG